MVQRAVAQDDLRRDSGQAVIPQLVEKFPRFAPAWLEFAKLAETP